MTSRTASAPIRFMRSLAMGVLLTMLFFYAIHVFGTWRLENYRPDPETTGTMQLYNSCAVFDKEHVLRPNTGISTLSDGISGTKLAASFMNFFDGHIGGMVVTAFVVGGLIFLLRNMRKKAVEHR